jgi:hypothetical protein
MKAKNSVDGVQWPTVGSIEFQDVCMRYVHLKIGGNNGGPFEILRTN